jgi:two-component system sensor histidine kinase KdpD
LEKKLDQCLEVILGALKARTGSIMLRRGRNLKVVAATNRRIVGLNQPLDSDSISAHVARTGLLLNLGKVSGSGRFKSHAGQYSDYRTDQVLAVPILSGRKVVGVLNITNRLEGRAFAPLDESRAVRFMERVGGLLDRAVISESLAKERSRLKKANRELKELHKLKQDLTQMVIHDLKGPLAEIMANVLLLEQESLSELGAEALESARLGAEDLDRLITNLLDVGRLEEGRLSLEPQPVNIRTEVGRVIRGLSSLLALHGLEVVIDLDPDLPPARIHPDFLGRIVQNLLTNAVTHAPGSGRLTCRARVKDGMIQLSLADQGPGVREEHREAIFAKFSQLPGRTGPRTSTGLGLTFCRLAVEAHGGKIWVQEGPSGGADFRFTLPVAEET